MVGCGSIGIFPPATRATSRPAAAAKAALRSLAAFVVAKAVLLHFCVCDFASFWRKRWTQLGYLSASDQFRVRTSSGAMMARFYRLQCNQRQNEVNEVYALVIGRMLW
eukprot:symbB.v1.2.009798.t1/scaffold614.1/size180566/8